MSEKPRHAIYRRRRSLIIGITAYLAEQEEPIAWDTLLELFETEGTSWKTLENTIRDLENFGAIHRIGKPADRRRPDTRALHATELGKAWLDQELAPLPGATEPEDLFEVADQIADTLEELSELELEDALAPDPFEE